MKYSNEWLLKSTNRDFLFFWGNESDRPYSQWYPSEFKIGDYTFPTAEHWMMLQKALLFDDKESASIIMSNPNPDAAKRQGKLIKGFIPEKWDEVKFDIVVEGNVLKFTQNASMRNKLMDTHDKVLVEASPYDKIWGIGLDETNPDKNDPTKWLGENLLGYALMEARDIIKGTLTFP